MPPRKQRDNLISADSVRHIFGDEQLERLARICKLPDAVDLACFAEGVREAACTYAREVHIPNCNKLYDEIRALYTAADEERYERVATLIENFSPVARTFLENRGARPSVELKLPSPQSLRDPRSRDAACRAIVTLCHVGGHWAKGRKLTSGGRSPKWQPLLHGPKRSRHVPKREAELNFIWRLQAVYLKVTGVSPPRTAHRARPTPFARMVQECLNLCGAKDASAVDLINQRHRKRLEWDKRTKQRRRAHSRRARQHCGKS